MVAVLRSHPEFLVARRECLHALFHGTYQRLGSPCTKSPQSHPCLVQKDGCNAMMSSPAVVP